MILKKSRRKMTPLAKRCAVLHNEAASLARRLRTLAGEITMLELNIAKERVEASDRRAFGRKR